MGLSNNDTLKKLRVALKLQDTDIIRILKHVDFEVTKSELGALFRKEDHPNYKECGDQLLRNFLNGLIIEKRGKMEPKAKPKAVSRPKPKAFKKSADTKTPEPTKPTVMPKPAKKSYRKSQDYSSFNKYI